MHPSRPHGHCAPSRFTTMWPISPAPPRPCHSRPSRMIPPPTPVPQKTPSSERYGLPAPSSNSAAVATETSLPIRTSGTPRSSRSSCATGTGLSKPGRLPAFPTVPLASSASPGEPSPTPARSPGWTSASSAALRNALASASTTACAPPVVGVGTRAWPSTSWRSSATIAWTLVPPRSMPPRSFAMRRWRLRIRPQPGLPSPTVFVREMIDGSDLDQVLMVREAELRRRRDGAEYLRLSLGDRTGAVGAVVWDGVADCAPHAQPGVPARVVGRFTKHPRYGAQITVRTLTPPAEGSFTLADLLEGPPRSLAEMERELRELLDTVREPHVRALLDLVFGESSELWPRFRDAPAAKHYHQAYRHGLLEHALSVGLAAHLLCLGPFREVDHDLAVTGALLHDIGKLEAYTSDPAAIDLSCAGRLQGEIPLGYYRIRQLCDRVEGFPPHLVEQVSHIILSHHGSLEHGSPVVPCTREATLVHFLDNLGGRLGSFDRLEKELAEGAAWSPFDRAIGSGAYFAARALPPADAEPAAAAA